jgi:hypothetical protein
LTILETRDTAVLPNPRAPIALEEEVIDLLLARLRVPHEYETIELKCYTKPSGAIRYIRPDFRILATDDFPEQYLEICLGRMLDTFEQKIKRIKGAQRLSGKRIILIAPLSMIEGKKQPELTLVAMEHVLRDPKLLLRVIKGKT